MVCSVGMIQPLVWMVWLSEVAASRFEISIRVACMAVASLLLWRCQAVAQLLAVRQHHFLQQPAGFAIAKRRVEKLGVIAGLQGALGPAGAAQHARARHLERPSDRLSAILGVAFH